MAGGYLVDVEEGQDADAGGFQGAGGHVHIGIVDERHLDEPADLAEEHAVLPTSAGDDDFVNLGGLGQASIERVGDGFGDKAGGRAEQIAHGPVGRDGHSQGIAEESLGADAAGMPARWRQIEIGVAFPMRDQVVDAMALDGKASARIEGCWALVRRSTSISRMAVPGPTSKETTLVSARSVEAAGR